MTKASRDVVITHHTGLHARPAVKFTKLAKAQSATVRLRRAPDGEWTDAKSIVKVMKLKLTSGTRIELEAEGEDAAAAVDALTGLVERDFDEHD